MPRAAFAFVLLAFLALGCARKNTRDSARDGRPTAESSSQNDADVDTGRVGNTFVVTYESGPVDRIRVLRDTSGRIVVEGASGFADGTRVDVTLLRPLPGGRSEPAAMARARVELGRFQTSPLIDESTSAPAPSGTVTLLVTVSFAPGKQSEVVMRASADGHRFRGHGMREVPGGHAVYEQRIEAPL
jgi:hypothetical protein